VPIGLAIAESGLPFDTITDLLAGADTGGQPAAVDLAVAAWMAVIAERVDDAAALAARAVTALRPQLPRGEQLAIRALPMIVGVMAGEREADHGQLDELVRNAEDLGRLEVLLEIANWFTFVDRFDDAAALVDRRVHAARRHDDDSALVWSLGCRAELDLRRGRWRQSRRDLVEALMISAEFEARAGYTHVLLARLAASEGDATSTHHHLAHARRDAYALGDRSTVWRADAVEGFLALSQGDAATAASVLASLDRHGVRGSSLAAVRLWDGDLVEALVRRGDVAAAETVVAGLAQRPPSVWTTAVLERARALVTGEPEPAMASAVAFGAVGAPFEQARSELVAGELARRAHRVALAGPLLQRAEGTFAALGAALWRVQAEREVRRCARGSALGPPTTGGGKLSQLTEPEAELAALVAQGVSNRDAAAALFVSVKTVEAHLTRIYRKLGVHSRAQLAVQLAEGPMGAEPPPGQ
jgi:ATP/maltotriose-dependent transcriptional regulator MalT